MLLFFIGFLLFILWINREHARIQETVTIVIITLTATIIAVLFFSESSKTYKKEISTIYFLSNKENRPLFFNKPILTHYHLDQSVLYNEFEKSKKQPKDIKIVDDHSLFCDLQAAVIMNFLSNWYQHNWFIKTKWKKFPGFKSGSSESLGDTQKDVTIYKKNNLRKEFSGNRFFEYVFMMGQLSLPKGTNIKYQPYTDSNKYCQIELYKPLCFNIKIKIYFTNYVAGLGNITRFVGISADDYDVTYGTVVINAYCSAEFPKFRSGDPLILKYKKWTESLFDDLYNTFDWEVCDANIKEYMQTTAYQAIVEERQNRKTDSQALQGGQKIQ